MDLDQDLEEEDLAEDSVDQENAAYQHQVGCGLVIGVDLCLACLHLVVMVVEIHQHPSPRAQDHPYVGQVLAVHDRPECRDDLDSNLAVVHPVEPLQEAPA
eukprot:s4393_g7.t1